VRDGDEAEKSVSGILDKFRLDERVVVVTGASSGLGAATAVAAAQAGAHVVLGARRIRELQSTAALVEAAARESLVVATDVTQVEDCRHLVRQAVDAFGRIDGLVNSAGVATAVPALREAPGDFRSVIELNLMGSYWMAQAAAEAMTAGGSIVNVSSILGLASAELPQAAYASSKAGVLGLTRDLATQWSGRHSIRVNALAPGFFESEMTDLCRPGYLETLASRTPLGRIGGPEEIAAAAIFLLSDASSFMTGATLVVDGGLTIA
jgi:NAD(P)-dependent dehydrogenase (short-subunit alcohol dehydrogenase family)